ncbi:MAG: hypothetical protein ABI977_00085 [Acidobacteriota bacterium]
MESLQKTGIRSFLFGLVMVMAFSMFALADSSQWRQRDGRRVDRREQQERKEGRKWDGRGPRIWRVYPPQHWLNTGVDDWLVNYRKGRAWAGSPFAVR